MNRLAVLLLALACLVSRAEADEPREFTKQQLTFFETKIRPVLVEHCFECHAAGAKIVQGALRVDHRAGLLRGGDSGPAIVPKQAEQSLLLKALRYDEFEMPPKGKLADSVIRDFEAWIAVTTVSAGRSFVSFQPFKAAVTAIAPAPVLGTAFSPCLEGRRASNFAMPA
ncbi:c-type cytochrome domain-containing protein [Lignipirellula cremea]|uniref:c-type cytochrome domain-containing protein n=1 Tax=Lignipirellula cremea TaxID=2528010 RepID=UPI00119F988D